jgi:hypothetical protein
MVAPKQIVPHAKHAMTQKRRKDMTNKEQRAYGVLRGLVPKRWTEAILAKEDLTQRQRQKLIRKIHAKLVRGITNLWKQSRTDLFKLLKRNGVPETFLRRWDRIS